MEGERPSRPRRPAGSRTTRLVRLRVPRPKPKTAAPDEPAAPAPIAQEPIEAASATAATSAEPDTTADAGETKPRRADPHEGWIAVGQVMGAFGATGDLRVQPLGRYPERFRELRRVYIGDSRVEAAIIHRRVLGDRLVLRLETVKSRDAARDLFGQFLYVPEAEAVPLPKGEYFVHQIVGLRVVTTEGEELGKVAEVMQTGSNDVYVVRSKGREVLLPAIKEVIKNVDLESGTLEVALLPGLLD